MSGRRVPLWRELTAWARRKLRGGPVPEPLCLVCWYEVPIGEARGFPARWPRWFAHPEHFEYRAERFWLRVSARRTVEVWWRCFDVQIIVTDHW